MSINCFQLLSTVCILCDIKLRFLLIISISSSFAFSLNFEGFQSLFPDLMVNFQQTASCMDCSTPDLNYPTENPQVMLDLKFKPEVGQGNSAITIQRLIDANYPLEIIDKHCPQCSRRPGDDKQFMINRSVSAVPPVVVFAITRQWHALADLEVEANRDITFYDKQYTLRAFNYHLGPSIDEGNSNFLVKIISFAIISLFNYNRSLQVNDCLTTRLSHWEIR